MKRYRCRRSGNDVRLRHQRDKEFHAFALCNGTKIVRTAENLEKEGKLPHARPDMKSEVTIDYTNKNHPILNALVFSCQHDETIGENNVSIFREELKRTY